MNTPPPLPQSKKPKLTWYQHVWVGWPIVLVAIGGAIGGSCGGAAWALNRAVFQKTQHPVLRYLWTGLISLAAVLIYLICATIVYQLMHRNS